jgi:predicted transcriptional regulator
MKWERQKKAIQEGLDDYKNGKLLSHDEVTARVKSKLERG